MSSESTIRDHLADNLHMIEDGLSLIKKEEHLKNTNGASGFVDLLARDREGRIVIIEIKKTSAASRQAMQELAKYAALIKSNALVKKAEYRLVVISADWHELLTPFSEFFHATAYDLSGGLIKLDTNGIPIGIELVTPLPPTKERRLSRRHFLWEFDNLESANAGAKAGVERFKQIGLKHFAISVISLREQVEEVSHIVYFAQQEESEEFYWEIIRRRHSEESIEEIESQLAELTEPVDRLGELADHCWDAVSDEKAMFEIIGGHGQISHPEKAAFWLSDDMVANATIIRVGLPDQEHISDNQLIAEFRGETGQSSRKFKTTINLSSRPELEELTTSIDNLLQFNPTWRQQIQQVIKYSLHIKATIAHFTIFPNDDIIKSIAWAAIGNLQFIPAFKIELEIGARKEAFRGAMSWDGSCPDWDSVAETFFEGDPRNLLFHRLFGSIRSLNSEIMDELGLKHCITHSSDGSENSYENIQIQGVSIVKRLVTQASFFEIFQCEDFIRKLVANEQFDLDYQKHLHHKTNKFVPMS